MPAQPQRKSLGELFKKAQLQAEKQPRRLNRAAEPTLVVRSISLTPIADEILDRLISEVEEDTGRKCNASAVVRALLRHADKGSLRSWLVNAILAETNSGEVVWGKAPKTR